MMPLFEEPKNSQKKRGKRKKEELPLDGKINPRRFCYRYFTKSKCKKNDFTKWAGMWRKINQWRNTIEEN